MVFSWSLSDRQSPQASRTLLSILSDLIIVVLWIVSTCTIISKSSSSKINPLVTVESAQLKIGITVTFKFISFFQFSCKVLVLISLFTFLQFHPVVSRNGKFDYSVDSLFFSWLSIALVVLPGLDDDLVSQKSKYFSASHLAEQIFGCAFVRLVKFRLLAQFPVDHLPHPVVSSLILISAFTYYGINFFVSIIT